MLIGRPWLKQRKTHHNWGDNTLTISSKNRTVMLSTIKHVNIKSSQWPKNLDNEFDWEEGLFKQEKEEPYKVALQLCPIKEVMPKELYFLLEIDCGML